jgi:lysophospholipase L1-like esterase
MTRILCFGDSITLGEGAIDGDGWADLLKYEFYRRAQDKNFQDVVLYNLGIAGETSDGLKHRFANEFKARAIKRLQSIVILAYGINDIVIHKNKNIVPEHYFLANLEQAINFAKLNGSKVLLVGLTPISSDCDGKINQHEELRYSAHIHQYNQALKSLANSRDCSFIDLHSIFVEHGENRLGQDGLHPNSEAHRLIARVILERLDELIGKRL